MSELLVPYGTTLTSSSNFLCPEQQCLLINYT